jgi:type IV pilus assembly protein PilA
MNNKRKGFTLVELLAVIVILAIILVIAVPNVIKVINKAKLDTYRRNEDMLINATQKYMASNGISLNNGESTTITYNDLKNDKLIDKIIDQTTKNECSYSKIVITKTTTEYNYQSMLICDNYVNANTINTYSLITNGDFKTTSGWYTEQGTSNIDTVNNFATTTNSSSFYSVLYRSTNSIPPSSLQNHTIFLKAKVRVKGTTNSIWIGASNGLANLNTTSTSNPTPDKWYDVYGTVNFGAGTSSGAIVKIYMSFTDAASALGKQMEIRDVVVVNLTNMYGSSIPSTADIYNTIINNKY